MFDRTHAARVARNDQARATVQRVDSYALRLDASTMSPEPHANGWVDVWGVATRVGVFEYDDDEQPGAVLREWRPPEEVLRPESFQTLLGVPFTIDHPADQVTSSTWRDLAHGNVLEVKADGDLIRVRIRIATDEARDVVLSGVVELSCGYTVRLVEERGVTPSGEVYDAVHRDIRYNHLALVQAARAGHIARLKLDAKGARVQRFDQSAKGSQPMKFKIKIDGKTYSLPAMLVPGMTARADEVAKAIRRGDAVATAAVTFESGGETVELVLPQGTVDEMLAMIGAVEGSAPEAPVEEPPIDAADPMEEPAEDPLAPKDSEESDPIKADAIAKLVNDAVAKALSVGLPKAIQAREDRARERASLERRCGGHLVAGYRFDKADDLALTVDTIEAVAPARLDKAKDLAARARRGDQRSRGRLDGMLDDVLEAHRDDSDDTGEQVAKVFDMRKSVADSSSSPSTPRHLVARQERIDRMCGRAPQDDGKSAS